MDEKLERYGDSSILCVLAGEAMATLFSWNPKVTLLQALGASAAAIAGAIVAGVLIGQLLLRSGRTPIYLQPKVRQLAIIGSLMGLIAPSAIGYLNGRPVIVPAQPPGTEAETLTPVRTNADGTKTYDNPVVPAVLKRRAELEVQATSGGPDAKKALAEIKTIDQWLIEMRDAHAKTSATTTSASVPPSTPQEPPPPAVASITRSTDEDGLRTLRDLLLGPFSGLVRSLLGLSLGGGYQSQVVNAVHAMEGGKAPSVAQLNGIIDALGPDDLANRKKVLDGFDAAGKKMLASNPAERERLRENLAAVRETIKPLSERIVEYVRQHPGPPDDGALAFLRDGQYASAEQRKEVEQALRSSGHGAVWERAFAHVTVKTPN